MAPIEIVYTSQETFSSPADGTIAHTDIPEHNTPASNLHHHRNKEKKALSQQQTLKDYCCNKQPLPRHYNSRGRLARAVMQEQSRLITWEGEFGTA